MNDFKVDMWNNYILKSETIPLNEIVEIIKSMQYEKKVKTIRTYLKNGDKENANKLKNNLPAFTVSGIFDTNRDKGNLIKYYGLVILDIDKLKDEEEVKRVKKKICEMKETKIAFVSPSGLGLKIIVETNNTDVEQHIDVYKEVIEYYEDVLKVKFDTKTCDVSRLCFISSDTNAYYNSQSKIFESKVIKKQRKEVGVKKATYLSEKYDRVIAEIIKFTKNRQQFEKGNRNPYVYLLVKNAKLGGLEKGIIQGFCECNYIEDDFPLKEIKYIINAVYNDDNIEFGKWRWKYKNLLK
ncbi:BT4734/BF3469 family protein [Riemerella anatipestifer]|nr:BT4734/BF3469 family protein [Riemerella anatipestifer]MDY3532364.1 BT4734/BF3469 family protein [Riemerella anatipestifer]MDY3535081.1 BT4734/BF3469 family protein [Riemerella anatipestifer]